MIKEGKFGPREAVWLVTITITSKVFFSRPAVLAGLTGTAAWYTTLVSASTALIGFYFIFLLLKRFPGKDLVEIFDIALGRVLGFTLACLLGIYMLFITATRIAELTEFLRVYIIPLSPNWFIVGIFIISVFTLSMVGLESMARLAKLLVYPLLLGFIVVLLLGMQNYDINNLFPVFGYGLDKIALHGVMRSSVYGEVIILAIFAGSFQGLNFIKKEGIISLILSGVVISLSILAYTLTFPYYTAQEITAPMYEMSTLIDYGRFIQRVDPIFLFIWVISTFISAGVVFYAFIWIFCQTFRIQDKIPIITGSCVMLYALSIMHRDIITVIFGYVSFIRRFGAFPLFLLPFLVLIVSLIRKKGVRSDA